MSSLTKRLIGPAARLAQRHSSVGCAVVALAAPALLLSACYVVPMAPDGSPVYPLPPAAAVARPVVVAAEPPPAMLRALLYPANDIATQTGMIAGTVANFMNGRGRFQMNYRGELLVGEATRVDGDERRGIANAYGPAGTYMSCDYRMTSPYQGAGTCTVSTGAQYSVHLGT
jgi:hypothetical protein